MADVESFIEGVDKTRHQYFNKKLVIFKAVVSMTSISQSFVLKTRLKKRSECKIFALGKPYKHKCNETGTKKSCKSYKEV